MNFIVIGAGLMGTNHARTIHASNHDLVGIIDVDKVSSNQLAAELETTSISLPDALEYGAEAAIVATPTKFHHLLATESISLGLHTLIEKPIAANLVEADEIIRHAERNNVTVAAGHVERFNNAFISLDSTLRQSPDVQIKHMAARRMSPFPARISDVGCIMDTAIHDIDLILTLADSKPKWIQSSGQADGSGRETEATMLIGFENGSIASLATSWNHGQRVRRMEVETTDSSYSCDFLRQHAFEALDGGFKSLKANHPLTNGTSLERQLDDFTKAIENSSEPSVTATAGRAAMNVAKACTNHLNSGKTFHLNDEDIS